MTAVDVPAVVGVPVILPVFAPSSRPRAGLPESTDQVNGPVPPVTVNVVEYGTVTSPVGGGKAQTRASGHADRRRPGRGLVLRVDHAHGEGRGSCRRRGPGHGAGSGVEGQPGRQRARRDRPAERTGATGDGVAEGVADADLTDRGESDSDRRRGDHHQSDCLAVGDAVRVDDLDGEVGPVLAGVAVPGPCARPAWAQPAVGDLAGTDQVNGPVPPATVKANV